MLTLHRAREVVADKSESELRCMDGEGILTVFFDAEAQRLSSRSGPYRYQFSLLIPEALLNHV
jgi:hypothetical protein